MSHKQGNNKQGKPGNKAGTGMSRPFTRSQKGVDSLLPSDPDSLSSLIAGCDEPVQAVFNALLERLSDYNTLRDRVSELEYRLGESEQYHRRATLVISNLPVTPDESEDSLATAVSTELSKSDLKVVPSDFQAIHRNGKIDGPKVDSEGKPIPPPSITVRFHNYNRKDAVLRRVRNKKGTDNVRVSQSLSPYYLRLRKSISDHCKSNGLSIRYIHYRSPSSGLVIKTLHKEASKQRVASKIFSFDDYINQFDALSK